MKNKIIKKLMEWCDILDPYWTMDNLKKIFIFLLLFAILHSGIHLVH